MTLVLQEGSKTELQMHKVVHMGSHVKRGVNGDFGIERVSYGDVHGG